MCHSEAYFIVPMSFGMPKQSPCELVHDDGLMTSALCHELDKLETIQTARRYYCAHPAEALNLFLRLYQQIKST